MTINGFKAFPNFINSIEPSIYNEINKHINLLDGLSRLTNQAIYLIDFHQGKVLYVSSNPLFLCGLNPDEVREMGGSFNLKYVDKADMEIIIRSFSEWFEFLLLKPIEERKNYSLEFDYHLNKKLICVAYTPAYLCKEGKPWIVLCNTKISINSKAGNAVITNCKNRKSWIYSETSNKWIEKKTIKLNEIEQKIIRLSILGKREYDICQHIFRSKDGLKSIKRKMFEKMNVHNITEAVSFAIEKGLI